MTLHRLLLVFVGALGLFMITTMPVSVAAVWAFPRGEGIDYFSAEGTIWDGRLESFSVAGSAYGDLRFGLRPLRLVAGTAYFDWQIGGGPVTGQGGLAVSLGVERAVEDVRVRVSLPAMPTLVPLSGTFASNIDRVVFDASGCQTASGTAWTDALAQSRASLNWTGPTLSGGLSCRDGRLVLALDGEKDSDRVAIEARIDRSLAMRVRVTVDTPNRALARSLRLFGFKGDNGRYVLIQDARIIGTEENKRADADAT